MLNEQVFEQQHVPLQRRAIPPRHTWTRHPGPFSVKLIAKQYNIPRVA